MWEIVGAAISGRAQIAANPTDVEEVWKWIVEDGSLEGRARRGEERRGEESDDRSKRCDMREMGVKERWSK